MSPFLWIAQYNLAKKLVIMPHSSLNRLAAEIDDLKGNKVTFVNMTARCGSTLLVQFMSKIPKTRCLSEPYALVNIHRHFRCGLFSMAEYKRLARSAVRLLCKREVSQDIEHIFMKTPGGGNVGNSPIFPILKELFPNANFIFNTRNFKATFESMMQLGYPLSSQLVAHLSGKPFWVRFIFVI